MRPSLRLAWCLGVLLLPTAVVAQTGAAPCGALQNAASYIGDIEKYFIDAAFEGFRAGVGYSVIPESAERLLITDNQECRPVFNEMRRVLRDAPDPQEIRQRGFEFAIYRFGPYYVALVFVNPPEGAASTSWGRMMVFDLDGKKIRYIGSGLV